jgi:23S rRNA (guanosine2251-2'-O)-methyltransferase
MNEMYVAGRNPVLELLKSEKQIDKLYVLKGELKGSITKIIGIAKDRKIVVQQVDKKKLDSMAQGNAHQGVVALVTGFVYSSVDEILSKAKARGEKPFVVVLDGVEDTHNLGAIIRTAECAGVHGVIIPKRRSAMVNQTVYKSSAGAVEYMKIAQVNNIVQTMDELKAKGLWLYGADAEAEKSYSDTEMTASIGIVIGGEGQGLTRLLKDKCDVLVSIPMKGKISSLNASNAASILIYEAVRQSHGRE